MRSLDTVVNKMTSFEFHSAAKVIARYAMYSIKLLSYRDLYFRYVEWKLVANEMLRLGSEQSCGNVLD